MSEYLNPIKWMRWASQFVSNWFLSLPLRDLPKGALAIIVVGVMFLCAIAAQSETSDWRGRLLDRQLQSAFERDDFGTAELVLNRKIRKAPNDPQLLFRLGLTKDALNEKETASSLMRDLVAVKRHDPAARWLLQNKYIGKDWANLSEEEKAEFGSLLALIYKEAPDDVSIKQMYADYLIASMDYSKAIPLLDDLARTQPMRGLQAAALSRVQGNTAMADRLAKRTLDSVEKLFEEDPTNSVLALAVAQNQLFLERHAEAVRTLERGITRAKSDEDKARLSMAMGDCIVSWVNFIQAQPSVTNADRMRILKMLQVALRFAPNSPRVLTLVADQVLAMMNEEDEQLLAVRNALVQGSSPGIAHFIRGTAALIKGDIARAETSLQLAATELPQSGAILNNLAVALTMKGNDHLERALKISQQAISQTPQATPHFFETRGQILYRLGRFQEAVPDLERALSVPDLARNAHVALAACYQELDEPELAKLHAEAAEENAPAEKEAEPAAVEDFEIEIKEEQPETSDAENAK
ncbi:Tetratricopeptide repeat protein [Rubripirellula tenax]|uniref:Tetratricopeptide repeat protein n=1 Tax=Rubripirellula tenax TaxID=2528015 RepID=A0A5C6EEY3_9BACT|nr:tetratricopeptide repeat protein [Rubripirellula tenax]TWU47582.1 Tetratricopeptide repeat protein [Rubripirellula tenax]